MADEAEAEVEAKVDGGATGSFLFDTAVLKKLIRAGTELKRSLPCPNFRP